VTLRKMEINLRKMAFKDFAVQSIVLVLKESVSVAEATVEKEVDKRTS
jgi:hypothetical protein